MATTELMTPPPALVEQVAALERTLVAARRVPTSLSVVDLLRQWRAFVDASSAFRGIAEEYRHDLLVRDQLALVVGAAEGAVAAWLADALAPIDRDFRACTTPDPEGRVGDGRWPVEPDHWWWARLPPDPGLRAELGVSAERV